jgi:hypothetical protein
MLLRKRLECERNSHKEKCYGARATPSQAQSGIWRSGVVKETEDGYHQGSKSTAHLLNG